jgi:hypothetical protein
VNLPAHEKHILARIGHYGTRDSQHRINSEIPQSPHNLRLEPAHVPAVEIIRRAHIEFAGFWL